MYIAAPHAKSTQYMFPNQGSILKARLRCTSKRSPRECDFPLDLPESSECHLTPRYLTMIYSMEINCTTHTARSLTLLHIARSARALLYNAWKLQKAKRTARRIRYPPWFSVGSRVLASVSAAKVFACAHVTTFVPCACIMLWPCDC